MNRSISHIKSVDDFNLIWNSRIDLYSVYFSQTLACSLALSLGFFGFLRSLYSDIASRGLDSLTIEPHHISVYTSPLLAKVSYTEFNEQLGNSIYHLIDVLNYYEVRKKYPKREKISDFVLNQYSPSEQDSVSIILPFSREDIYAMFFQDLYPSLSVSLVSFLESKFLFSINKKNTFTFMQKYEMNNEDLSLINHSLSNADLNSANENANLRICSLVAELYSELNILSNSYSALLRDKAYLELKVKNLYDLVDLEKKQGINGYLRTWH